LSGNWTDKLNKHILSPSLSHSYSFPTWTWFHQHFNVQVLHLQIPKAQKDIQVISVSLCFWDLLEKKLHVNVGEIDPLCQFYKRLFHTAQLFCNLPTVWICIFWRNENGKAAYKMLIKLARKLCFSSFSNFFCQTWVFVAYGKKLKTKKLEKIFARKSLEWLAPGPNLINILGAYLGTQLC